MDVVRGTSTRADAGIFGKNAESAARPELCRNFLREINIIVFTSLIAFEVIALFYLPHSSRKTQISLIANQTNFRIQAFYRTIKCLRLTYASRFNSPEAQKSKSKCRLLPAFAAPPSLGHLQRHLSNF